MKLKITQFGDKLLRKTATELIVEDIKSDKVQMPIKEMKSFLIDKKLGIGLAAPQIGESVAVAIVELQKTELRPEIEELSIVIINPKITLSVGRKTQLWEGCISAGNGSANLFAKVPRYKKIELEYHDEFGDKHVEIFSGLSAHVIQHGSITLMECYL